MSARRVAVEATACCLLLLAIVGGLALALWAISPPHNAPSLRPIIAEPLR